MTGKELESVFKGDKVFELIDNWDVCRTKPARESVLTAMGALA